MRPSRAAPLLLCQVMDPGRRLPAELSAEAKLLSVHIMQLCPSLSLPAGMPWYLHMDPDSLATICFLGRTGWFAPLADAKAIWRMVCGSLMNLLLIMVPLGWAAKLMGWSALCIFVLVS